MKASKERRCRLGGEKPVYRTDSDYALERGLNNIMCGGT